MPNAQQQIDTSAFATTTALGAEATTRATNDTTLQSNITAEATTRAAADTTLTTNVATNATAIATETTNRTSADTALTTAIGKAKAYITVDAAGAGDYTTIVAALAAVPAGGGTLFIRGGTYAGGFTISTAKTRLLAEGKGLVVIQAPLSSANAVTVSATDVAIEGVEIDGRRASGASGSCISVTAGSHRLIVKDCYLHDTSAYGIISPGSADVVITGNKIYNIATNGAAYTAIAVTTALQIQGSASARVVIERNDIQGWAQAVGLWYGANNCRVVSNTILNNYGYFTGAPGGTRSACEDYGELVAGHGYNLWALNIIDGSTSECIECAQGTVGSSYIGNVLRNPNKFGDNTGAGIKVAGQSGQLTTDILFEGNVLYGDATNKTGVLLSATARVQFVNNRLIGCANTGSAGAVYLYSGTDYVISGNMFIGCSGAVYVAQGNGHQIIGNRILAPVASTTPNIGVVAGSYHTITGNHIDCNGQNTTGIYVATTAGGGHRIANNTIVAAISWGVDVGQASCIVEGNYIVTTNVFGAIHLGGSTALRNTVKNNYCDATGNARAIFLDSSTDYNVIQGNWIVGGGLNPSDGASGPRVFQSGAGAHNITAPNHTELVTRAITLKALGAQTVGTSQSTIAHGLGYTPTVVQITMSSAGTIWRSAASDATSIYLTADSASRTCEVYVR